MFIYKRDNGYYYLYWTENGKRRKLSTKTKSKSEALKFLMSKRSTKTRSVSVSELQTVIQDYAKTNSAAKTQRLFRIAFDNFIRISGNKPIADVTAHDIEHFKAKSIQSQSIATVNIYFRTLRSAFGIAVRMRMLSENPFRNVKEIPKAQTEILAFTDGEARLIIRSVSDSELEWYILTALYTGMRLNEICNLKKDDIDTELMLIKIRNTEVFQTKTKRMRQVPINPQLIGTIENMPERMYTSTTVSKKFKKLIRSLGMSEKYHFHCLRHTFITSLVKLNVNLNYIKELAGHSDIKTTMNYIHIVTEDVRESVNRLDFS